MEVPALRPSILAGGVPTHGRIDTDGHGTACTLLYVHGATILPGWYVRGELEIPASLTGPAGWDAYLQSLQASNRKLSDIHARRLAEQRTLIESHTDALSLRHAMRCFSSLQQIKLLRLQDESDEIVLEQVRRSHTSGNDGPRLDWELACTRAIMGLSTALLGTNLRCVRFLAPQLIPEAGLRLVHTPRGTMAAIAERLTSLDITLYSPQSLTPTLSTLSPVFRRFFQAARNLTSIHVGFSPTNPADVPLEQVFHHVHWERLRSLGIQGWRLTCLELIGIVRRHSACLEELRLPYVHLHQGSSGRWRDLLAVLHDEMNRLRRVDLRGINYYQNLDDEDDPDSKTTRLMMGEVLLCPGWPSSVCDCEHGGQPRQIPSTEQLRALGVDDLGDDGLHVEREHWTLWQAWLMATPRTEQVNGFAKLY